MFVFGHIDTAWIANVHLLFSTFALTVPHNTFFLQVLSRTIPGAVLTQYTEMVRSLEEPLREHFRQEKMKV